MYLIVARIIIGGLLGYGGVKALNALFKDDNEVFNGVDCHDLFLTYNGSIGLSASQDTRLGEARRSLQRRIKREFLNNPKISLKGFFIQGSKAQAFNTVIVKSDGTYDVDLGVFLTRKPSVSAITVQKYLFDAVCSHTKGKAKKLEKCVRVVYSDDFNIDLTIYALAKDGSPMLATKSNGWVSDDTKAVSEWFRQQKAGSEGQLVRVIKYLKKWAERLGFKTPSGFALTVWASQGFEKVDNRDDLALYATLKIIRETVHRDFTCSCPAPPFDNLTSNLSSQQREKFIDALDAFIQDAETALKTESKIEASRIWYNHLGDQFPLANAE